MKSVTDVFMVSYAKDIEWFRWSVAITVKNLKGFRKIVAVAPVQDRALFDEIALTQPKLRMVYIPDWPGAGYYWQQWVKMNADAYTDAKYIAHMDSDVYVKEPVNVSDFFSRDGKNPAWLWAFYTDVRADDAGVWKAPTERAIGAAVDREFMEGFPFIMLRSTYQLSRAHLDALHGDHKKYIQACSAMGGPAFSEFNFMGAIAWTQQRDLYHWVDRNREEWPAGYHRTRQFWSHAKFDDCLAEIRQMFDGGTDQRIRVTNRGIWVLSNDTHISRWVEQENRLDHDVPTLQRLCKYIKPGDTVVDVGAFIGDHTIAYARAVHGVAGGKVIAFEPNPPTFECLKRNMAGFGHVQCLNAGLSDEPGEMAIEANQNAGASHLKEGHGGVNVVTLDEQNLERLNFMKIDAEGMELRILRGAEVTIVTHQPVLYIEINRGALERAGTSAEEVLHWLKDHGYKLSGVEEGPQFDVLCLPKAMSDASPFVLVLGVSHREVHLARIWLRWVSHLCKQVGGDNSKNILIIFTNRRTSPEQLESLKAEVGDNCDGMFKTYFARPDDEQEAGYPGSASHLFVRALEHVEKKHPGMATLWCEADTVPTRPSWFFEIASEYQVCGKPFMGGQAGLGEYRHMTGNGVYPHNWRDLAPLLLESFDPRPSNYWVNGNGDPWDVFARSQIMPNMHLSLTVQQIWRPGKFHDASQIAPSTALFHQCKDGSLIAVLARKYPGFKMPTVTIAFTMCNRYTEVEVAGRKLAFELSRYVTGLGWVSYCIPLDYTEELELHVLANQQVGIEAVPISEARDQLARSRLQNVPVNTLRL